MEGFAESDEQLRQELQRVATRIHLRYGGGGSRHPRRSSCPAHGDHRNAAPAGESDRSVLDLILAIGQMCRQAAERITDSAPKQPRARRHPPLPSRRPTQRAIRRRSPGGAWSLDGPALEASAPAFTQMKRGTSLWRVPLVSSFLLTTGGLLLLRYL